MLQHVGAAQGREGVEVYTNNKVRVVGEERRQLVVYCLVVEIQLVELCKGELELLVGVVVDSGGVGRIAIW